MSSPAGLLGPSEVAGLEKPFRLVQPPVLSVELECRDHFAVDSFERLKVADGPEQPEAEKDDLVAERLRGERESGSRNRKLVGLTVEIFSPRFSVITAGPPERPDDVTQWIGSSCALVVAVGCCCHTTTLVAGGVVGPADAKVPVS